MAAARRDIGPALQKLRAFLLGRNHTVALRFEDGVADRTQPPPDIPEGPSHKLAANYYCNRDARREVEPPLEITGQKLLEAAETSSVRLPTPGKVHNWD